MNDTREQFYSRARTKIVATVGPACRSPEMLRELIQAGVSVFRLNTAHGTSEIRLAVLKEIRKASEELSFPVGVLLDLAGPKIRLGELFEDPCEFKRGASKRAESSNDEDRRAHSLDDVDDVGEELAVRHDAAGFVSR